MGLFTVQWAPRLQYSGHPVYSTRQHLHILAESVISSSVQSPNVLSSSVGIKNRGVPARDEPESITGLSSNDVNAREHTGAVRKRS